jgi:hypothetical protein
MAAPTIPPIRPGRDGTGLATRKPHRPASRPPAGHRTATVSEDLFAGPPAPRFSGSASFSV